MGCFPYRAGQLAAASDRTKGFNLVPASKPDQLLRFVLDCFLQPIVCSEPAGDACAECLALRRVLCVSVALWRCVTCATNRLDSLPSQASSHSL